MIKKKKQELKKEWNVSKSFLSEDIKGLLVKKKEIDAESMSNLIFNGYLIKVYDPKREEERYLINQRKLNNFKMGEGIHEDKLMEYDFKYEERPRVRKHRHCVNFIYKEKRCSITNKVVGSADYYQCETNFKLKPALKDRIE